MSIRKTVVSGSFYPNDKDELEKLIKSFSNNINKNQYNEFKHINAIVNPHAGYIYSGKLCNLSFNTASKQNPKRIIVIGPSHNTYFEGSSICLDNFYETPLGNIEIDLEYSKALMQRYDFLTTNEECAFEHSSETQAPFIKYYFPNAKIIEIVYGNQDSNTLSLLLDELIKDENNLLVISTDLSHFHPLQIAKKIDENCISAINEKDLIKLENCEACGKTGIKALLESSNKNSLNTKVLDYSTSCDVNNDKTRVVGYLSAIVGN